MKMLIKFQEYVGVDRMLHFLVAAVAVLLMYPYGFIPQLFMTCVMILMGLLKEVIDRLDGSSQFDWIDMLATWSGSLLAFCYECLW